MRGDHELQSRALCATPRRRIAIIGAGGAGACAALELASRGHDVEVFEKTELAVSQASFINEGKIHLGFIYAKDSSCRTAFQMIDGALEFEENLRRWIPFSAKQVTSRPFHYCVHRGSLLDAAALAGHYERCTAYYRDAAGATGRDYLGLGTGSRVVRLKKAEYAGMLNPDYFTAVFKTTEYAVDPRAIAVQLREALAAEPRIEVRTRHTVLGVQEDRHGGYRVSVEHAGTRFEERFSDVVNAAWYQRLPIDRPMGIVPPGRWLHRYKFGNRVSVPLGAEQIPSCTCVQGPFGDIVNFGSRGLFVSWYPIGRTGMSTAEVPPDWEEAFSPEQRREIFQRSFAEWKRRCAALGELRFEDAAVDADGGVIYALGTTDVDDGRSKLHDRFEIGIQSKGRYHTVDTGKFTLVPYWGLRIADRVEGAWV